MFNTVHSIAMGPQEHLYIADRENGRLQWFDDRGEYLSEWKYGGQFYAVAFGPAGEFYAATHPQGVSLDNEFNVVKIDPRERQAPWQVRSSLTRTRGVA